MSLPRPSDLGRPRLLGRLQVRQALVDNASDTRGADCAAEVGAVARLPQSHQHAQPRPLGRGIADERSDKLPMRVPAVLDELAGARLPRNGDAIELGLAAPIVVVALEHGLHALLALDELERPGADRIERDALVAVLLTFIGR